MRVRISADHGCLTMKDECVAQLCAAGREVVDFGVPQRTPDDDYPDYEVPLAQAVVEGKVDRGVEICGSGVGASVCANKIRGVRACLIHDHFSAKKSVEDDHLNILRLGGRTVGPCVAWDLVQAFLGRRIRSSPLVTCDAWAKRTRSNWVNRNERKADVRR